MNQKVKAIIEVLVIVIVFIIITYLVQTNLEFFENIIKKNIYGILVYLLIVVIAMVVAPISAIPLIPLMANIWGWKVTGVLNIVGWTIGAIIIFFLTRKYGVKIVRYIVSLKRIHSLEKKISEKNVFLTVLLLRMIIPVDILSYALGLFSKIRFWPYTIATVIGIIPGAFILSYVGTIGILFQIVIFLTLGIIILTAWIVKEKHTPQSRQ